MYRIGILKQSQHLWNVNMFWPLIICPFLLEFETCFFVEMKTFVLWGFWRVFFTLRQTCWHFLLAKGDFYQKRQIPGETSGVYTTKIHGFIFNSHQFQILSIFIPILGKWSNMRAYFSNGLVQPPTRHKLFKSCRISISASRGKKSSVGLEAAPLELQLLGNQQLWMKSVLPTS